MPNEPYRAKIAGWGRYPVVDGLEYKSENLEAVTENGLAQPRIGPLLRRLVIARPKRSSGGRHDVGQPTSELRPHDGGIAQRKPGCRCST